MISLSSAANVFATLRDRVRTPQVARRHSTLCHTFVTRIRVDWDAPIQPIKVPSYDSSPTRHVFAQPMIITEI